MKRVFIVLFALFLSFEALAQLEVKNGSFKEVPGFVNLNDDPNYQADENDKPYAIIKVRTEGINDKERKELKFGSNLATAITLEYHTGEVWVYITAETADYIKISHPDFGTTEFSLPIAPLKPKQGYELLLIHNIIEEKSKTNYVTISCDQADAKIYIDDQLEDRRMTTTKSFEIGTRHRWRIECPLFNPESGTVYVTEGDPIVIQKELVSSMGYLNITSNVSKPKIYVDDEYVGKAPIKSYQVAAGDHNIRAEKKKHYTANTFTRVDSGKTANINLQMSKVYKEPIHIDWSFLWDWTDILAWQEANRGYFLTASGGINSYGIPVFSFGFGQTGLIGYSFDFALSSDLSTQLNTDKKNLAGECGNDYLVNGYYPAYTGKTKYTCFSVGLGILLCPESIPFSLKVCGGFMDQSVYYQLADKKAVKNKDLCKTGIYYGGGILISISKITLNTEYIMSTIGVTELRFGISAYIDV